MEKEKKSPYNLEGPSVAELIEKQEQESMKRRIRKTPKSPYNLS